MTMVVLCLPEGASKLAPSGPHVLGSTVAWFAREALQASLCLAQPASTHAELQKCASKHLLHLSIRGAAAPQCEQETSVPTSSRFCGLMPKGGSFSDVLVPSRVTGYRPRFSSKAPHTPSFPFISFEERSTRTTRWSWKPRTARRFLIWTSSSCSLPSALRTVTA